MVRVTETLTDCTFRLVYLLFNSQV